MITAKISSKGQITLPKNVCKAINVKPGERMVLSIAGKTLVLRPLGPSSARDLAGSLGQYARPRRGVHQVRELVRKEVARAAARER